MSVPLSTSVDWDETKFRDELVDCPKYAWVTIIFFITALVVMPLSAFLANADVIPVWLAVVCNAYCLNMLFMVMHDSAHRSVSQVGWVNEWTGRISIFFVIPFAVMPTWRFSHLRHHANTNEDNGDDPDLWVSRGPKWLLPLRWATLDNSYLFFLISKIKCFKKIELVEWAIGILLTNAVFVVASDYNHLTDLLLYWILPTRINVFFVALIFDYLPHNHNIIQREKPFNASTIRPGWDLLGAILMMNQNYHTMHHVYPRIPFYKIRQAWFAKLNYHLEQHPTMVSWLGRPISVEEYRTKYLLL